MKGCWLALAAAAALYGGTPLAVDGRPVRVRDGRLTLHLPRTVHGAGGASAIDPGESAASVQSTLAAAARSWTAGAHAGVSVAIDFADPAHSPGLRNSVTFTEPRPFDSGVCDPETFVACAVLSVTPSGEVDAFDIAFNPAFRHSSIGLPGAFPIAPAMLHELGHVLGLDHSAVMSAAMSPFAESAAKGAAPSFGYGGPTEDDLLTLAEIYPADGAAERLARIEGRVMQSGGPRPGAHLVAIREKGLIARGVLSRDDGTYAFALEPGRYRLAVEPLDGPVVPGRFVGSVPEGPVFPTFFSEEVTAEAGLTVGIDFAVADGPVCDVPWVAIPDAAGRFVSSDHVSAARSGPAELVLRATPESGTPAVLSSAAAVVSEERPVHVDVPGAPGVLLQLLEIRPEADLGPVAVLYRDGASAAMLAGGLRIVPRPRIASVEPAEVRPGDRFVLRGSDLAPHSEVAPDLPAGLPCPAYLGGVSVRLGDRFVPLWRVAPDEIVGQVPEGIAGTASLEIVTGPNTRAAAGLLRILDPR